MHSFLVLLLPLILSVSTPISIKPQFDSIRYGNWLAYSETSTVLLAKHFSTSWLEGPLPQLSHFPAAACQTQQLGKKTPKNLIL